MTRDKVLNASPRRTCNGMALSRESRLGWLLSNGYFATDCSHGGQTETVGRGQRVGSVGCVG